MADIKPFQGLLYNPSVIKDPAKVVAPPYDVISPDMQDKLYKAHQKNIVRLILGKGCKDDNENNNKYKRAKRELDRWIKEDTLVRDKEESLYIHEQIYTNGSKSMTRTGFFSLMKIEDPAAKIVMPHEKTLARPKVDRLNLITEVRANLSPIFALYNDDKKAISKILKKAAEASDPIISIQFDGIAHKLWRLSDKKKIDSIKSAMRDKRIVIADGHHRYEVARAYRDMTRGTKDFKPNMDYVMVFLTNLSEPENVTIFSTHRLIRDMSNMDLAAVKGRLAEYFDINDCRDLAELFSSMRENGRPAEFGVYFGGNSYIKLSLKKDVDAAALIDEDKSPEWKKLDVAILHSFIIRKLLSLKDSEDNVKYVRDPEDAVRLVDSRSYGIAFLLNPTKPDEVKRVALKGDTMPQKSTYFYPKVLTGLVMHRF